MMSIGIDGLKRADVTMMDPARLMVIDSNDDQCDCRRVLEMLVC